MKEIWKEIKYYPNYMVSNLGRVKSLGRWVYKEYRGKRWQREKILKPKIEKSGYQRVGLWKNGKQKLFQVHRLVAQAFIKNPNNYPQVNHKNEIKDDNRVENLEYCDAKYNVNYGTRNKRVSEKMKGMKLSEETKNKISEANSKPVLQYELNGNFIKEWPSTMEVERRLGFANTHISACCKGKLKQSYGFKWKYK